MLLQHEKLFLDQYMETQTDQNAEDTPHLDYQQVT